MRPVTTQEMHDHTEAMQGQPFKIRGRWALLLMVLTAFVSLRINGHATWGALAIGGLAFVGFFICLVAFASGALDAWKDSKN